MKRTLLIVACSFFCLLTSMAQDLSWKKHVKLAETAAQKRAYAEAATHYEAAWRAKPAKLELMHQAAECYYLVRNFKMAAVSYEKLQAEPNRFGKSGLKYARSLKQTGQYDAAIRAFVAFINAYDGKDRSLLSDVVHQEILGCELGLKEVDDLPNKTLVVEHLDENINTIESEFAPITFSDDILYFSSLKLGKAKIFRSQRQNGVWEQAQLPKGFAKFKDEHFCNGAFSSDYNRFYFTICDQDQAWGGLSSRCEIYVTKRSGSNWTSPKRLPDHINMADVTNTHPCPVINGDQEILYFASNRAGGRGGMDIWYSTRSLSSGGADFDTPTNCGVVVNTIADEITPFYDEQLATLYFSSNGHISVGGYDIFSASGQKGVFESPENLGLPINSPADDNYYVHLYEGNEGFVVSNRTYGMEKISTTQEDIFAFYTPMRHFLVEGNITDKNTNEPIEGVEVALYELQADGLSRLLMSKEFEEGAFYFKLLPQKKYELRAEKGTYRVATMQFNTDDANKYEYERDFFLEIDPRYAAQEQEAIVSIDEGIVDVLEDTPSKDLDTNIENAEDPKTEIAETEVATIPEMAESMPETTPAMPISENTMESAPQIESENTEIETEAIPAEVTHYDYTMPEESPTTTPVTSSSPTTTIVDAVPTEVEDMAAKERNKAVVANEVVTSSSVSENTASSVNLPWVIRSSEPGLEGGEVLEGSSVEATTDSHTSTTSSSHVSAPSGTYYKIQLIAVKTHSPNHRRYRLVKELGRLDTEYISEKDLTRVLLSDFFSETEAYEMLETVKERGFEGAFIVQYKNGSRKRRLR